ncbi:MAG: hypothetical protein KDD64_07230 [Bdellovibrionales bacterium]|nr:hypothetical protein [Bdellovibrionales bacterium]
MDIEQFRRELEREVFGTLKESGVFDSLRMPRAQVRGRATEAPTPGKTSWEYRDFLRATMAFVEYGALPQTLPDSINLNPLLPIFRRLSALAEGRNYEVGRAAVYRPFQKDLVVKGAEFGTETEVRINTRTTALERPMMLFHTHPGPTWEARANMHFSGTDVKTLLGNRNFLGSVVVTSDGAIILFKTDATRTRVGSRYVSRVDALFDTAKRMAVRSEDYPRIGTKLCCKEFGLELFIVPRDQGVAQAKKVIL